MDILGQTPLWAAARTLLASRVDDFFGRWRKVRKTFDLQDIHDLRVSSRRLREGLDLFAPVYPPALSRRSRTVRKVTRLLGAMRNADEAILFFREMAVGLPPRFEGELGGFIARLESVRRHELRLLEKRLEKFDVATIRSGFANIVAAPFVFPRHNSGIDPFTPIVHFAAASLEARLAELLPLVPAACREEASEAQHVLRIAVKRYRYCLEIFADLVTDGYEEILAVCKEWQEWLGTMHDLDVFAGMVRDGGLPSEVECVILNAVAERRKTAHAGFLELRGRHPFEQIGSWVRGAL
ncbi:CHAD domain-containing protein [Geobacter benzoatilyticus]|uniref:CHAD domain-containing protein n=1 Tax=Geobacter benzoatilyticus TaxID=2815309 RepID=A0ABX7Q2Z4_9BACT|nr:CHAD domain-containing protein [Geobacter benzoatilyticus]QSV45821.1 CHAD domain-containing protein [Geobacter benzoatilyticus]